MYRRIVKREDKSCSAIRASTWKSRRTFSSRERLARAVFRFVKVTGTFNIVVCNRSYSMNSKGFLGN